MAAAVIAFGVLRALPPAVLVTPDRAGMPHQVVLLHEVPALLAVRSHIMAALHLSPRPSADRRFLERLSAQNLPDLRLPLAPSAPMATPNLYQPVPGLESALKAFAASHQDLRDQLAQAHVDVDGLFR